ncbi:MAG: peptidyl-tRNA hydrolase [Candidatus Parcubacteria bacterium]|nr:MAG: peptidyl-tRNA hydrolase [Candidatus Parcubacteria bacterium]
MEINFNKIKVIIGLGNDLKELENTYHNIGQLAIKYLNKKFNNQNDLEKEEKNFKYSQIKINNNFFYLIYPKTYMNESGLAFKTIIKKFNVKPENILIIHDDSDLNIGNFKYVFNRGSAGHHGIESIFNILKSKNFWRLRIGIRPKNKPQIKVKAEEFVLKKIKTDDKKIFYSIFDELIKKLIENTRPSASGFISENGKSID